MIQGGQKDVRNWDIYYKTTENDKLKIRMQD